ncbi:MAG: type II toxin-antitoxin system RelE/ParE family toxin [Candidatus Kaiserbacteria bacterium]|nr:type II toxin-antitoxin system RelE/ParE family toxin [Candidatus Kaiserbacteria bacterium]
MKIVILDVVHTFLGSLDFPVRSDAYKLLKLLEQYGHSLSMPVAKPIGGGLWELRLTGRPQIRILYGFCEGIPIVVLALRKQRSALPRSSIALARKRFREYCG